MWGKYARGHVLEDVSGGCDELKKAVTGVWYRGFDGYGECR